MRRHHQTFFGRLQRRLTAALVLALLLANLPLAALAQAGPDAAEGRINDSIREFGVWWVEDYDPPGAGGSDLPATRPDALGLRDQLTSTCKLSLLGFCFQNWSTPTWTARFVFGNGNAWASDWRRSQNGGSENFYIDTIDLAYFAGHGSANGLIFGANSPTPRTVTKNDALNAWGDRDLDWIGLAACNILDNPISNLQGWAEGMNGIRLIMGFQTVMNDVPHGVEFGRNIRDGYTMTQAWFKAADKLQSQGRVARVLAEQQAYFNDTHANHNSTTVVNWPKYYLTHSVGSEPARPVNVEQIGGQMPVLVVQPLDLDAGEDVERLNALGQAFGVDVTQPEPEDGAQAESLRAALQEGDVVYSQDGQLEMDRNYGLFLHADKENLWIIPEADVASGTAMQAVSQEDARGIADRFLTNHNLLANDAQFFEVKQTILSTLNQVTSSDGEVSVQVVNEESLGHQVIYSRIITYTPPTIAGTDAISIPFSVMGPGSKLKIYVASQVPAGVSVASITEEAVQGGMGGYRNILTPEAQIQATGAVQMVDVLPYEVIVKLFENFEPTVALDHVPLAPSEIVSQAIISDTLAYWEGPIGFNQGELIPVYALTINNVMKGVDGGDDYDVESTSYIPVDPSYMAPLAHISTTVDLNENVAPGQTLVFEALDASMTLAELGLDPSPEDGHPLNFALGSGGTYFYNWYLNEVEEDSLIGTGRVLEFEVNPFEELNVKGTALSGNQRIILEVRDVDNNSEPNTSRAEVTISLVPPTFVPQAATD